MASDSLLTCASVMVGGFPSGNCDWSTLSVSAYPQWRFTTLYLMSAYDYSGGLWPMASWSLNSRVNIPQHKVEG